MKKFKIFLISGDYIFTKGVIPYAINNIDGVITLACEGVLYRKDPYNAGEYNLENQSTSNIVFYPHSIVAIIEI